MRLAELIPTLQLAIGPVILISGVGLLLLTMTNRYGRIIDRARVLSRDRRRAASEDRTIIEAQLAILARRVRLVRAAIALASFNLFMVALLIIMLFLSALLALEIAWVSVMLFVASMVCLIGALALFIVDIELSLKAFWLEMPEGRR